MIKLTNGAMQDAGGVVQPNGYLVLQLSADATVIASPGTVVRSRQITFRFDANGNLSGSCQIYSNAELSPQTQYQVTFFDKNNSRLSDSQLWQFTQSTGATVDIGTMVAVGGGTSYPQPVVQNPTGDQVIQSHDLLPGTSGAQGLGNVSKLWNAFLNTLQAVTATITSLTVTTLNKLTFTQPATGATLTIADGKTARFNNTLTLAGTDGQTKTFPNNATGNVAEVNTAQTWSADQTSVPLVSPTIKTGVSQGSGLKHQRFGSTCTTGASAGNTCTTAYTWTAAFADANYTASCTGGGGVGTNPSLAISSKSATQITVVVQTNFNVASSYGTVDCIAMHD